ncbi:hypothetical protein [Sansalvadorimonas verongulae]|uniref:hypothetical protein n=1 Tax=Sansalvadorimonas verongulae TaxID=2172824 RepID=UPI0012BB684A|nr:hypothetical protein [Sansalvadorimonas verongulae]MTI14033.1 hypothetical protein [Sansalvadorimonas verongulae]
MQAQEEFKGNSTVLNLCHMSATFSLMRLNSTATITKSGVRAGSEQRGKHSSFCVNQAWLQKPFSGAKKCYAPYSTRSAGKSQSKKCKGRASKFASSMAEAVEKPKDIKDFKSKKGGRSGQRRLHRRDSDQCQKWKYLRKSRFTEKEYSDESPPVFQTSRKGLKRERRLRREAEQNTQDSDHSTTTAIAERTTEGTVALSMPEAMRDSLGAFRSGYELKAYQEKYLHIQKRFYEYTGALSRTLSDSMRYLTHRLEEMRAIKAFEYTHNVHVVGETFINEYIDISLMTHVGETNEYGQAVDPHVKINFKKFPEPETEPYISDTLEQQLLNLMMQCKANRCYGINIWPMTTPASEIGTYNNPFSLMTADSSGNALTLCLEWLDESGSTIDAITADVPLFNGDSFQWVEQALQMQTIKHSATSGKAFVSVFSPEILEYLLMSLKYGQNSDNFDKWQLQCERHQRQRYMPLFRSHCKKYGEALKKRPTLEFETALGVKAAALSKRYFLVFDYLARLDYPVVMLVKM